MFGYRLIIDSSHFKITETLLQYLVFSLFLTVILIKYQFFSILYFYSFLIRLYVNLKLYVLIIFNKIYQKLGKALLSYSHSCMRKFLLMSSISRSNCLVTDGTQHDVKVSLFSSDGGRALSRHIFYQSVTRHRAIIAARSHALSR